MAEIKVVRSKDVLDAITGLLAPIKGKKMLVSDIGLDILRCLSSVPEFYAEALVEITHESAA